MLVEHRRFAGGELRVVGDEAAVEVVDPHPPVERDRLDLRADEAVRDRVTRRRDPDRGQLVDLAHLDAADPWAQHRQLPQQRPLLDEPHGRDGARLGVHDGR